MHVPRPDFWTERRTRDGHAAAVPSLVVLERLAELEKEFLDVEARLGDPDLIALSHLGQGQAKIMIGDPEAGLMLLDEVMVAVTAGEVSPVPSGIVYCALLQCCRLAFDLRRAHEWTRALDHWCEAQPDMVAFSGQCQAQRAALFILHGAWGDALAAAESAQERSARGGSRWPVQRVVSGRRSAPTARRTGPRGVIV